MLKKIKKVAAITTMLCLLGANTVFAADPTVGVTGEATATIENLAVANFSAVILDGTTKTTTAAVTDMALIDARGTGDGWSVSLDATQFINATAENPTLNTLPFDSLELGTVSIVAGTDSTPITNITTISTGTIDNVSGVNILSAPINEGMGTYTISLDPMTLTLLPKDAKAGVYTSTVTATLAQGPVI